MSKPEVIITRAEPGATATAERVRDLGFVPHISPALSLHAVYPVPALHLNGAAGVIFTSANGVRFFAKTSAARHVPAWCVGPSTYETAQEAGFSAVYNANGNSVDLANLITKSARPKDGHLLHIANTAAGKILQDNLTNAGFDVRFVGLYEPKDAPSLSSPATNALQSETPSAVLLHSAKGASAFSKIAANLDLIQTTFISVSDKASKPISSLGTVLIADRPNEASLLRVLDRWKQAL